MNKSIAITEETVLSKIYLIRGKKVMLDRDLAQMYGVEISMRPFHTRQHEIHGYSIWP